MVIWLIGLSGAGKTTIGRQLYRRMKEADNATVLVDGDEIRAMFRHDIDTDAHTLEGRRINAERIRELCLWLDRQNINVVCCILSVFRESSDWNRQHYSRYFEVYVDAPMSVLEDRSTKDLYRKAKAGEIRNVVGVDIEWQPPLSPDLVIHNGDGQIEPRQAADLILSRMAGARD